MRSQYNQPLKLAILTADSVSHLEVFCRRVVLADFANSPEDTCDGVLFLSKFFEFYWKKPSITLLFCERRAFFQNTYSIEDWRTAASYQKKVLNFFKFNMQDINSWLLFPWCIYCCIIFIYLFSYLYTQNCFWMRLLLKSWWKCKKVIQ